MVSEWKSAILGDHISIRGGLSYKGKFIGKGQANLITMGCVSSSERFEFGGLRKYAGEFTERHRLRAGDIVVATRDVTQNRELLGSPAIVPGTLANEDCIAATNLYMIQRKSEVSSSYLYWLMRSPAYREHIIASAKGTTVLMLTKDALEGFEFKLPPAPSRDFISKTLDSIDDKIELNRRMAATLEEMARALFKSWFVDFEPVRAKAEGRPTGLPPDIDALFPNELVESELGLIPRGWATQTIESVCKLVTRGVTPEYEEGTGRFIINQKVNRGKDLDWNSLKELSRGLEVPPDRYAKRWDVLVNCLGEGTLGRTHLYKGESDIYAIDQHMSICRAEYPAGGAYIYQVLTDSDGQAKIESLKTGSTGMTMFNISKLRSFEMIWPSAEILAKYFNFVKPLWLQIASNEQQSRTLATLRDILLPKLMSGEIKVSEMEIFAEGMNL